MRLPLSLTSLGGHGPTLASLAVMLLVLILDWGFVGPTRARVQTLTREAEQAGISVRPSLHPTLMPPAVRSLMSANALEESRLASLQRSGALAAELLESVNGMASRSGIRVVGAEPGVALSSGGETVVRAHLRATGTFDGFVRFLNALSRGDRLIAVDRFVVTPSSGGQIGLELNVSRLVVKRTTPAPEAR